ncbi:hypothetical protein AU468_12180 [Alkalispirochaeta sphaeroplastigenens]|uniref:Uncharacterized protein n=1 Tax=Alkalispirochaeta sphaeroplastigenens TaxID=1187066 RepID=A0A2S4JH05_9SPIO|nr:hypothetical protein [Alkalispirochaeta sphaeroplastigenens]POQ98791.1 hypothetical protein AU468_12180 [Alkalispirochaeta sphaeroplastigenens]
MIRWRWNDPDHIDAHRADFSVSPERVMEWLVEEHLSRIEPPRREGWLHRSYEYPEVLGRSGLREVPPDGSASFWGYRKKRTIPSHLCEGEKSLTRHICLWGWWEEKDFVVHTLYPGERAPREIHDPDLKLQDLPDAIAFWRIHAIVVEKGDWSESHHRVP